MGMTLDELLEGVELPAVVRRSDWCETLTWTVYYKAEGSTYYGKYSSGSSTYYEGYLENFEFPTKPKIKLYRGVATGPGREVQWHKTKEAVPESWDYIQTIEVDVR